MRVEIFDVEHGGCALITTDQNQHVLIDCGHRAVDAAYALCGATTSAFSATNALLGALGMQDAGWRPSEELNRRGVKEIDKLIVANYDSDHVSDFHNILGNIYIAEIFGNPTISMSTLRAMKKETGGIGTGGLATLVDFLESPSPNFFPRQIQGVAITNFWVEYKPLGLIRGTNNLSVITFVSCGGLHMIFPGDIEGPAWELALTNPPFLAHLQRVNVFVASHHGRLTGYHSDVFKNGRCAPEIAVISDKSIMHSTQESAASRYGRHVSGILLNGEQRRVLTTRDDGNITFEVLPGRLPTVRVSR